MPRISQDTACGGVGGDRDWKVAGTCRLGNLRDSPATQSRDRDLEGQHIGWGDRIPALFPASHISRDTALPGAILTA
jgi:hypothetical protein